MRLSLFFKLFVVSIAISLVSFAVLPDANLLFLAKILAFATAGSIIISILYPEIRGVHKGDVVSVVISSSLPSLIGRSGRAVSDGKKNSEIRVRFDSGEEAVGIVESYAGLISPPKVRILYEERIKE